MLSDVLLEGSFLLKSAAGKASDAPAAVHESKGTEPEEPDLDPSDTSINYMNKV